MLSLLKRKKKEKLPARQRGNSCLNCAKTLDGNENFCPECGQRNNTNQLSFKLVVDEFFGDLFTYDSRLWKTVVPLIIKPGKIANRFVLGRRKDIVNPFRTYLTVSLIFFLILGLLSRLSELRGDGIDNFTPKFSTFDGDTKNDSISKKEKDSIVQAALATAQKNIAVNLDSTFKANNVDVNLGDIKAENISMDSLKNLAAEQNPFFDKMQTFYNHYESHEKQPIAQALDTLGYENTFWNRFYYDKARDTKIMFDDKGESFNKKIFSGLSIAIFLSLPIFAWFLKLFYIRRKYTYMEHLVFVFYTQSVFFLLLLLFSIIYFFIRGNDNIFIIPVLLFSLYLLIAMKRFYNQNWFKTIVKYTLANFSFIIVATMGLVLLTFISFIFY